MDTLHLVWSWFVDFVEFFILAGLVVLLMLYVHDRYVQRKHALLINYPVIG